MKLVSSYEAQATPCLPVDLQTISLPALSRDMEGMEALLVAKDGLGLAAPQVGIFRRFFLIDLRRKGGRLHWIFNPEMIPLTKKINLRREGCLTIQGEYHEVIRWQSVALRFQDVTGRWENWGACKGLLAAVVQHEMDHFNGICIRDISIESKQESKEAVK